MTEKGKKQIQWVLLIAQLGVVGFMFVSLIGVRRAGGWEIIAEMGAILILLYLSVRLSKSNVSYSMNREQAAAWAVVRTSGKRRYIQQEILKRWGILGSFAVLYFLMVLR